VAPGERSALGGGRSRDDDERPAVVELRRQHDLPAVVPYNWPSVPKSSDSREVYVNSNEPNSTSSIVVLPS
jgi:hypothetical protein